MQTCSCLHVKTTRIIPTVARRSFRAAPSSFGIPWCLLLNLGSWIGHPDHWAMSGANPMNLKNKWSPERVEYVIGCQIKLMKIYATTCRLNTIPRVLKVSVIWTYIVICKTDSSSRCPFSSPSRLPTSGSVMPENILFHLTLCLLLLHPRWGLPIPEWRAESLLTG